MMEGTRIPDAKRRRVPMSPAMNSSTEKPSRDGSLPSTLANRLKARDTPQIAETAQIVKTAPEFQPDSGQFETGKQQ